MIELNRIYNEDCLEGMKRIPDKSVWNELWKMTNDLITEARELCADAQLEAALLELKTMSGWLNKVVYHKLGIRWSFDNNNLIHWIVVFMRLLPELCDALEKAQAEIERLREFKAYFDELYGQGLDVMNWHLNGSAEHFDSFFDSALEQMNQLLPAAPEEGAEHERD